MFSDLAKLIDHSEEKIAHKEVRRILAQTVSILSLLYLELSSKQRILS